MKNLLLILMLAVVSSSAMAEWVYIGKTEKKNLLPPTLTLTQFGKQGTQ